MRRNSHHDPLRPPSPSPTCSKAVNSPCGNSPGPTRTHRSRSAGRYPQLGSQGPRTTTAEATQAKPPSTALPAGGEVATAPALRRRGSPSRHSSPLSPTQLPKGASAPRTPNHHHNSLAQTAPPLTLHGGRRLVSLEGSPGPPGDYLPSQRRPWHLDDRLIAS